MPAGWGGNGAYYYLLKNRLTGYYTFQIDNYYLIRNGYDIVQREDFWKLAAKYIPASFFRRVDGNCSLGDTTSQKKLKISASCWQKEKNNLTNYNCKILDKDITTSNPDGGKYTSTLTINRDTYGNILDAYIPPDFGQSDIFEDCAFDADDESVTCTVKRTIPYAMYTCLGYGNSQGTSFNCPDRINKTEKDGYGICGANNGGNGAVVILW